MVHLVDMVLVFGECDVAGLGVAQWAGGIDRRVGIAHDLTTDPLRQLTKDDGHGSFLSSVVQTGSRATAQGYRARIVTQNGEFRQGEFGRPGAAPCSDSCAAGSEDHSNLCENGDDWNDTSLANAPSGRRPGDSLRGVPGCGPGRVARFPSGRVEPHFVSTRLRDTN